MYIKCVGKKRKWQMWKNEKRREERGVMREVIKCVNHHMKRDLKSEKMRKPTLRKINICVDLIPYATYDCDNGYFTRYTQ